MERKTIFSFVFLRNKTKKKISETTQRNTIIAEKSKPPIKKPPIQPHINRTDAGIKYFSYRWIFVIASPYDLVYRLSIIKIPIPKIHKITINSFSNKEAKTARYKIKVKKAIRNNHQCGRCL
ncbi:MAG: hypothetical protein L6265_06135 [Thermoplasmatales archaeon]|nr:hypothetical protein [Thermoplasmatales archaeon]